MYLSLLAASSPRRDFDPLHLSEGPDNVEEEVCLCPQNFRDLCRFDLVIIEFEPLEAHVRIE